MADNEKKFNKALYLKKNKVIRKGQETEVVDGAVKLWLKNPYGEQAAYTYRNDIQATDRQGAPITRSVCNVEGSMRVDEFLAKQLKYFFGLELPVDSFINVRISLWDKRADALMKFGPQEKD